MHKIIVRHLGLLISQHVSAANVQCGRDSTLTPYVFSRISRRSALISARPDGLTVQCYDYSLVNELKFQSSYAYEDPGVLTKIANVVINFMHGGFYEYREDSVTACDTAYQIE